MRLQEIARRAKAFGFQIEKPTSGSHWKLRRISDGKMYPIPAHNGLKTEVRSIYLDGFLRFAGLSREEFCDDC